MRIVFLTGIWPPDVGGPATHGPEFSRFLVERGHRVVVLTMGEARPLQNVGGLTAAAMMTAALATFVAVPVLARKRAYDARPRIAEIVSSSPDFAEPTAGEPAAGSSPAPARGSS